MIGNEFACKRMPTKSRVVQCLDRWTSLCVTNKWTLRRRATGASSPECSSSRQTFRRTRPAWLLACVAVVGELKEEMATVVAVVAAEAAAAVAAAEVERAVSVRVGAFLA